MSNKPRVLSKLPKTARKIYLAERDKRLTIGPDDVAGRMGSFISDHPTNFNWRPDVEEMVERVQRKWPWLTYANTYWWHPPYDPPAIDMRYDPRSVDFWGGGVVNGKYMGYRGKPLPIWLHDEIWKFLFNFKGTPDIYWACTQGWLWTYYGGWSRYDPFDPQNADLAHRKHLHLTYR